ncbi:MAG: hypothetical protein J6A05_06480 [Oscillospiraceae bacterium]|nr:hypothetical protein [Oscillospiraceae bacterium]
MKKVYKIEVRLLSAMHINAGIAPDSKRVFVKSDGKPYIPATLFKGLVRSNFEMLLNTYTPENIAVSNSFFGEEGYCRSHAVFDNLFSEQAAEYENRVNVSISRYTRNKVDTALVFSEVVSRRDSSGQDIVFSGDVTVYYSDKMLEYEKFFIEAVKLVNSIGSGKSRGLGYVEVSIVEKTC